MKPDERKPPDFRSLLQVAQTEQGRFEVSCVIDHDHPQLTMAKPMIFLDDTRPSHFTFANQVGVQIDEDAGNATTVPDELRRTIDSRLWLTNVEASSGITPTMFTRSDVPREPHADGPARLTLSQLSDAQLALAGAHIDQDVSQMLKRVVTNVHLLAKFSREAGFVPYLGHAHYLYDCYWKSRINASPPPSTCDLGSVWSLRLRQGHAQGSRLGVATFFVTCRPEWHHFSCHSDDSKTAWEALFAPSESSHRDPNRAPTVVAPSTPVSQDEETPSVPETPRFDPEKRDTYPDDPAVRLATKIEAKDSMTQTPPLVSRLTEGYLENTGIDACPLHQMDHEVRDSECDYCKRALGPLYHHKIKGSRHLPVFTFDFSGPHTPGECCPVSIGLCVRH